MRRRTKKKILKIVLITLLIIVAIERIYNSQDKFQTTAKDASYYGILDAGFTNSEKMKEFNYLYDILEEYYPFFNVNERVNNIDWLNNKAIYKRILRNTDNDAEYLVALDNILGKLNDDNTYVFTGDIYRRFLKHYYPERSEVLTYFRSLGRYNFFEGFENIQLDPNNNLIFYNGPVLETKKLIEDKVAYMRIKDMSFYHIEEDYPRIISFLKEVEGYDKLIIDIRGNAGWADEYWMKLVELLIDERISAEYYSFFRSNYITTRDIFRLTDVSVTKDLDEVILEQFPKEITTDFQFYKINTIEINPNDDGNFGGEIYLLVDGEVKSAAEKFAAFTKDTGFATLVGEKTGGGMTFDEVPMAYLPYGGFIINYSREMVMNSDGTINMEEKTTPHIIVDDTTPNEDYSKDKCIQIILEN